MDIDIENTFMATKEEVGVWDNMVDDSEMLSLATMQKDEFAVGLMGVNVKMQMVGDTELFTEETSTWLTNPNEKISLLNKSLEPPVVNKIATF